MPFINFPLLSVLLMIPLLGMVASFIVKPHQSRYIALATQVVILLYSIVVLISFKTDIAGFQFIEKYEWISTLNIHYSLGVDGISILFLPATALLFIAVTLASWNSIQTHTRTYYALSLLLELAVLGIFTSLDTIFFMLFWEATLIPMYFFISLWGVGANRRYAGMKYVLFMLAGGILILFAFVLLAIQSDGSLVFDYIELLKLAPDNPYQTIIFVLLLIGFGVKTPLFPMHSWLPVLAQEGHPATISTIVGLKLGAYGLMRFTVALAPNAAVQYQYVLITFGIVALIYGAIAALKQTNIRRMLAFSSLSHVGLVVIGIATFTEQGIQGAVMQLLNFTIFSSALFLLSGFLLQRIGSTDILSLGGVAKSMPLLTSFFFFFGLASMGVPGTNAFPAELLIIIGALDTYAGVGLAILFGVVLTAAYFLSIFRKSFLGECVNDVVADAVDLKNRELLIVFVLALIVLITGFFPSIILEVIEASSQSWLGLIK